MFSRISSVLALALCASASVLPRTNGQCNTGSLQCCDSVESASNPSVASLAGILGLATGALTGQVGLTCNPITVLGVGGNNCASQPVCCTGNNFNGALVLGCTPVNLSL